MPLDLDTLRAKLAADVGLYHWRYATGGTATTLIDTIGLSGWSRDDAHIGGVLYIRTTTDGLLPQAEWRRVSDYDAATQTLTVPAAAPFSNPVDAGDSYELYLSPLELGHWDRCINNAILSAWPEVYERQAATVPCAAGSWTYPVPDPTTCAAVDSVGLRPGGDFAGWPFEPLVLDMDYRVIGSPNVDLQVELLRRVEDVNASLVIYHRHPFVELGHPTAVTTNLDPEYLLAAARAEYHAMSAGRTRGQAEQATHLQLLNYWRAEAQRVKQALAAQLLTGIPVAQGGKGK